MRRRLAAVIAELMFIGVYASSVGCARSGAADGAQPQIRLSVTGVCALWKNDKKWVVLIPRADDPQPAKGSPHVIPGHRPYLMVTLEDQENLFPGNVRPPDFEFRRREQNAQKKTIVARYAVFFLDDDRLTLEGVVPTKDSSPATDEGEIVSFGKVCCLAENPPDERSPNLSTRVELEAGDLRPGLGTVKNWFFIPGREDECARDTLDKGQKKRRLARSADLLVKIAKNEAGFSFRAGRTDRTITFPDVKRDLHIEIGNAPVEDILLVGKVSMENIDPHFELLYKLMNIQRDPHLGPLHIPYTKDTTPEVRRAGASNCPPVTWP